MRKLAGVKLEADTIRYKGASYPLAGAQAAVEALGQVRRKVSFGRFLLIGPLAFFAKKKIDERELYLTVAGPTYQFVAVIPPGNGKQAREFAAAINTAASRLGAPTR